MAWQRVAIVRRKGAVGAKSLKAFNEVRRAGWKLGKEKARFWRAFSE
jgi:hypothetical protein